MGSLGTSLILVLVQLVVMISRTREFDFVEQGKAAIFVINIDLIAHICMFVGGSSLVYLASRHSIKQLIVPSYIWALAASTISILVLLLLDQIPGEMVELVFITGLLQGLYSANQQLLLGYDQIKRYNLLQLLMFVVLMGSLLVLINLNGAEYEDFVYAYLIAVSVAFVTSWFALKPHWNDSASKSGDNVLKTLFKFGFIIQVGAFAQRLNSRLTIYVLNASFVSGIAKVGLLGTAQMIVEKLMIGSRSLSTVQYAAISNNRDEKYALNMTSSFIKLALYGTLVAAGIMILIPESVYLSIIGKQWIGVHHLMVQLTPAICLLAISNILSHFFSGLGDYHINTYSALIGLGLTLMFAFILIPESGILGCIQTITISYSCKTAYQIKQFYKRKSFSMSDLILNAEDMSYLMKKKS